MDNIDDIESFFESEDYNENFDEKPENSESAEEPLEEIIEPSISDELDELMPPQDEISDSVTATNDEISSDYYSVQQLLELDLPPVTWIVEKILPTGLALITSRPKVGKSILSLNLAVSVATGTLFLGRYVTEQNPVFLLSNEDSKQIILERINAIASNLPSNCKAQLNSNLFIKEDFEKLNLQGKKDLYRYIYETGSKLVIIDMLGGAIEYPSTRKNAYFVEYDIMASLRKFAKAADVCLFLVHHSRKQSSSYHVDSVLGTTGISGAAHTIWTMQRSGKSSSLEITGKQIEELEIDLSFNKTTRTWSVSESLNEFKLTPEQNEVLKILLSSISPLKLNEICQIVGKTPNNVNLILVKLMSKGLVLKPKYGFYQAVTNETDESNRSDESDESGES